MQLIEQLETRRLLASFTAASVAELISDINAANAAGGSNTITLVAGTTFKLDAVDSNPIHVDDGPNGLPVIAAGDDLTIIGNGDTIQRATTRGTPAFRLFDVAFGGSLNLSDLTLAGGLASTNNTFGISSLAGGGAILSRGTLSLDGVTIQNCTAQAQLRFAAFGGGIYSSGVLNVVGSAILNNQALGSDGFDATSLYQAGPGAPALGGGLYVAGSSATLTNTMFSSNLARGGDGGNGMKRLSTWGGLGGPGGAGAGGAIYVAAGTVTLRGTTISRNAARGGLAGITNRSLTFKPGDGAGQGGGLFIAPAASVSLDSFTQTHTSGNTASSSDNDIFGSFTVLN